MLTDSKEIAACHAKQSFLNRSHQASKVSVRFTDELLNVRDRSLKLLGISGGTMPTLRDKESIPA